MNIVFNEIIPIYIQIADAIEDDVLSGRLAPGQACYSQIELAKTLGINPATAAKGIRMLVERGVLDKVRGQAMTVREDAIDIIRQRRIHETLDELMDNLIQEAKKLDIPQNQLVELLNKKFEEDN